MQKLDNLYVSELEFEDDGMRGPQGIPGDAPSLNIRKAAPFLYQTEYKSWDEDKAETFVRKYYPDESAACASIRKGGVFGHNFDSAYDQTVEFVVRTTARNGRHGSIGIAAIPGVLTADMVDSAEDSDQAMEAYDALPCFVIDGVNDAGVAAAIHYMPDAEHDDPSDDSGKCAMFTVRFLLDYADSAEHAVSLLENQTFWFPKNNVIKGRFYVVICDKTMTVFSDLNGGVKIIENGENSIYPILTNFDIIPWDGTHETLSKHANGLERYDILNAAYEGLSTEDDVLAALKSIRYTGVYNTEYEPFWFSDYNGDWTSIGGKDLTIDSAEEDYAPVVAYCVDKYKDRARDGATMHTMHTVAYDMDEMTMMVMVQEEDKTYRFYLDEAAQIYAERERAIAAEQAIRDEFHDFFYTKAETDQIVVESREEILRDVESGYYKKEEVDNISEELYRKIDDETDEKLEGKADTPENGGSEGQVLYKTAGGSRWDDLPQKLPDVTEEQNDYVLAVEDGKWAATDKFADYIRYVNITVSITSDNGGVPMGGIEVTVKNADTGDVINQKTYNGQPVTFRVPRGLRYIIEQSGVWEGYHNPQPDKIEGAATNDTTCVFTYEAIKIPETLRELQIIVDSGSASSLKSHVGLQFDDKYDDQGTEYDIIWDLKDVLTVYDQSGTAHTGVILEWHNATPNGMPFDAPERLAVDTATERTAEAGVFYYGASGSTIRLLELNPGDPLPTGYDTIYKNAIRSADGNVIRRGYAGYGESAVRKWLNSNKAAGSWWEATHVGDVPPDQADTIEGFMAGCSDQILSMAKPVRVRTAISRDETVDLYDTFFIPSVTEVYGVYNGASEGEAWEDWVEATGLTAPGNAACAGRKIYPVGGSAAQLTGLRSANVGYQYITWDVKNDGSIDGYGNASTVRRYTPCCVIYK